MLQPDVGMWRCAGSPFWWGELPIPVLMALLFSFSLLPLGAQEISLLLVSRVSLVCDPLLLSGEVAFRELPPSLVPCRESSFGGRSGSHKDLFSQLHPQEMAGRLAPTRQIVRLHHAALPCCRLCQPRLPPVLRGQWGSPGTCGRDLVSLLEIPPIQGSFRAGSKFLSFRDLSKSICRWLHAV